MTNPLYTPGDPPTFKKGDRVKMRHGSPIYTVARDQTDTVVDCHYTDGYQPKAQNRTVWAASLVYVKARESE